jgi:hypothetical protein
MNNLFLKIKIHATFAGSRLSPQPPDFNGKQDSHSKKRNPNFLSHNPLISNESAKNKFAEIWRGPGGVRKFACYFNGANCGHPAAAASAMDFPKNVARLPPAAARRAGGQRNRP